MLCAFVRKRIRAISKDSQGSHPNRRRTKCTEHVSKEIRPSKRLEFYILQTFGGQGDLLKQREGVPEMGAKPLKALRGYQASNRGSEKL